MKPDPPPSDVSQSKDIADLPPKRKWFGYAAVAASLGITYALWLAAMAAMRTLLAVAGVNARRSSWKILRSVESSLRD